MKDLKVIALKAENIKRLTLVNLALDGENLRVAGAPGQGKTTLVELVWAALVKHSLGPKPVQEGKETGYISVHLAEPDRKRYITVRREYDAAGGDKLKVTSSDGGKVTITDIQRMLQSITFDPMEFYTKKGAEQVNVLLRLLGVNLGDIDTRRKELYDERTAAGRVARAHRDSLGPMPVKAERVSITELAQQLTEAQEWNRVVTERLGQLDGLKKSKAELDTKIEKARDELAQMEKDADTLASRITRGEEICKCLESKDTAAITTAIQQVETTNRAAEAHERWLEASQKADTYDEQYKKLDEKIVALDQEKAAKLQGAKWPVAGLNVDGDLVLFNGTPLVQQGEGKKLEVSFAIAAALNPDLRICRIDGAESLGAGGRAEILRIAKEHDMQVFMARVADGGAEDGEITIAEGGVVK